MPLKYNRRRPIKRVGLHYTGFRPENRDGDAATWFRGVLFTESAKVGLKNRRL